MSYANMQLFGAVLPRYESREDRKRRKINADDPRQRDAYNRIIMG